MHSSTSVNFWRDNRPSRVPFESSKCARLLGGSPDQARRVVDADDGPRAPAVLDHRNLSAHNIEAYREQSEVCSYSNLFAQRLRRNVQRTLRYTRRILLYHGCPPRTTVFISSEGVLPRGHEDGFQ